MKKKILINISCYIFIIIIFLPQNIKADDLFNQGKIIFVGDGNCATCHSLDDANSNGKVGPNLNEIKPDISRVLMAVTNGIGVMPAYQGSCPMKRLKQLQRMLFESTN